MAKKTTKTTKKTEAPKQPFTMRQRRRQKDNPGMIVTNMGKIQVISGSVQEIKGKYSDGLRFRANVPSRTAPISISTFEPKLMEAVKHSEKTGQPLNRLLEVRRGLNEKGRPQVYWHLSERESGRPVYGERLVCGTKEVYSEKEKGNIEVPRTQAYIQGSIGAKCISVHDRDKAGNPVEPFIRATVMAAGHPVTFFVPYEECKTNPHAAELMEVLDKAVNHGQGSVVSFVADIYTTVEDDGVVIKCSPPEVFYQTYSPTPVNTAEQPAEPVAEEEPYHPDLPRM